MVEVIVGVGSAQELEEVDAALRGGGGKEGEVLVADVGGVAVLAAMARPGVIDVNVGAGGEPCGQELVFFAVEGVVVLDEHTVERPEEISTPHCRSWLSSSGWVTRW